MTTSRCPPLLAQHRGESPSPAGLTLGSCNSLSTTATCPHLLAQQMAALPKSSPEGSTRGCCNNRSTTGKWPARLASKIAALSSAAGFTCGCCSSRSTTSQRPSRLANWRAELSSATGSEFISRTCWWREIRGNQMSVADGRVVCSLCHRSRTAAEGQGRSSAADDEDQRLPSSQSNPDSDCLATRGSHHSSAKGAPGATAPTKPGHNVSKSSLWYTLHPPQTPQFGPSFREAQALVLHAHLVQRFFCSDIGTNSPDLCIPLSFHGIPLHSRVPCGCRRTTAALEHDGCMRCDRAECYR